MRRLRFLSSFTSGFVVAGLAGGIVALAVAVAQIARGLLPPSGD